MDLLGQALHPTQFKNWNFLVENGILSKGIVEGSDWSDTLV